METETPQILEPVLHARTVQALLEQQADIKVLDVRTPAEFESAHIAGAYNVPLDTLAEHGVELHRNVQQPVVLVCRSGQRARQADVALRRSGMANLHVLDGGVLGWQGAGFPLRHGAQRWSLERQVRLVAGSIVVAGALGGLLITPALTLVAAMVGAGLTFSAATDTCAMGTLLGKLPYNRRSSCDVGAMVQALTSGESSDIGFIASPRSAELG